jgi:hypothetical protein
MIRLSHLPKVVPFLVSLALLMGGLIIGGIVGFVLMGVAALFVGWILYLSWPRLKGTERLMRSAVLLVAVAMAVVQLFPRRA